MNQPPQLSWRMCCEFHASGPAFGKVMSAIEPRHAVAYHHQKELSKSVLEGIRQTYQGPLSLAEDLMVWNITPEKITERMAIVPDNANAAAGPTAQKPPVKVRADVMSQFIKDGEWGPGFNAQNEMLDEFSEKFDLEKADWRPSKPW